ncbi:transglutaminase-like domain-containing protein [Paraferrimonas sedimenticola]|nr:transglutaminase family protein [Paraferrimonas sedimenticola]
MPLSLPQQQALTQATEYFDYQHPAIQELLAGLPNGGKLEQVLAIYRLVRDDYPYNPYSVAQAPQSFKASYCLQAGEGYCIPKSALMVAMCRAIGVPARLGLADVKNHLSSPRLIELLGSDVFTMHGYVSLYLNERWVKATPVFDATLCQRFGIEPLVFDGVNDSLFQAYTQDGSQHMEYLVDHGCFDDVPTEFIFENFEKHYPKLMMDISRLTAGSDTSFSPQAKQ